MKENGGMVVIPGIDILFLWLQLFIE